VETSLEFQQVYDAPIQRVWRALTNEEEMHAWYFAQLQQFRPLVGFEFVFANDGSPYQKEWRVTRVEEGRLLAHSWVYKGYPGSSEVIFKLFDEGGKTRLKLTHTGLASFPQDPHFARNRFEDGCRQILGSNLKDHLAKNTD
jgi:uncharacterized protein YndB with AHSA1/START domain